MEKRRQGKHDRTACVLQAAMYAKGLSQQPGTLDIDVIMGDIREARRRGNSAQKNIIVDEPNGIWKKRLASRAVGRNNYVWFSASRRNFDIKG